MPSLLVPVLTKNPVPHPNPAMLQLPPAGIKSPEMRALPSMIRVMGLVGVAAAIAALMRAASSVAGPPVCLLLPVLRSQSSAQPISDALIYVMPGTGVGGGAGPRHGMTKPPDSQFTRLHPNADPTAMRLVFKNLRLSTRGRTELCSTARLGRLEAKYSRICLGPCYVE